LPGQPAQVLKAPRRLARPSGLLLGLDQLDRDLLDEAIVAGESEHVVDPVLLAPGHQDLAGEARVGPKQDAHPRPAGPDPGNDPLDRRLVMRDLVIARRLRPAQLKPVSVLLPATGAQSERRAASLPASTAIAGSWRRCSWSLRSSYPSAMPNTRWPMSVATSCSIRSRRRASTKQPARRPTRPTTRSVAPSKSAPASEVIVPPSKPASTRRPSTGAKPNKSALHCVGIGENLRRKPSRCCTTTLTHSEPRCTSPA